MQFATLFLLSLFAIGYAQMGPIPAVTEINAQQYFGTWYEVYANAAALNNYQQGSYCATATYGPNADGTISVHNYQRNFTPVGPSTDFYGYAYASDPAKPAELSVRFDSLNREGSYWIIKLGPVVNGLYDWALVSDMYSYTFYVLARDVSRFYTYYEKDLLIAAIGLGFAPVPIYQGVDCVYTSDMTPPTPVMSPTDGVTTIMSSQFPTMEPTAEPTAESTEAASDEEADE